MPELIEPAERLHAAWLEARAEWGSGVHEDGFGLMPTDDVDSPAGFAAWVERLAGESERSTYRWIIEDDQVLGGIALRHEGNDIVPRAGHIGCGIRPPGGAGSQRGPSDAWSARLGSSAWNACWLSVRLKTSPRRKLLSARAASSRMTPGMELCCATGSGLPVRARDLACRAPFRRFRAF